jgi:hypothetical protein
MSYLNIFVKKDIFDNVYKIKDKNRKEKIVIDGKFGVFLGYSSKTTLRMYTKVEQFSK